MRGLMGPDVFHTKAPFYQMRRPGHNRIGVPRVEREPGPPRRNYRDSLRARDFSFVIRSMDDGWVPENPPDRCLVFL